MYQGATMAKPTTVVIDPDLLARAKTALGVETTRAAVDKALRDAIWRQEQLEAIEDFATIDLEPNPVKVDIEP